jgi:hypothetical protein
MDLKEKLVKASLPVGTLLMCKGTTYLIPPLNTKGALFDRATYFTVSPKTHLLVLQHVKHKDHDTSYQGYYVKVLCLDENRVGYFAYYDLPIMKVMKVD